MQTSIPIRSHGRAILFINKMRDAGRQLSVIATATRSRQSGLCSLLRRHGHFVATVRGLLFLDRPCSVLSVARRSHGIVWDRLRLYREGFREIELPLPPLMNKSISFLTSLRKARNWMRCALPPKRTIDLLKERRAALIAAAVTGKIHPQPSIA